VSDLTDGPHTDPRASLERGDYLLAFEQARAAVRSGHTSLEVRRIGVLALARAGATDRAARLFEQWGLSHVDGGGDPAEVEDLWALRARIAKDAALAARHRADFAARCADAARRYERIWQQLQRPYSGVNAASLWCLAGDTARALELADLVAAATSRDDGEPAERYWAHVTLAECAVVRGEPVEAAAQLDLAERSGWWDVAARASTRRQLDLLLDHLGHDTTLLEHLPVPGVVHFTGHMAGVDGRFRPESEAELRQQVAGVLEAHRVGFGYGALGAGADLLIAEELLARGADLHVVLPAGVDAFVRDSVAPGGDQWVERFHRCVARAASLTELTSERDPSAPTLLAFSSRVAMGCAVLQARRLVTRARQLALWDGTPGASSSGTGHDVRSWHDAGLTTDVVAVPSASPPTTSDGPDRVEPADPREQRAVLVADFKGFGHLDDRQIMAFVDAFTSRIAQVLDSFGEGVLDRNMWGDGLQAFFDDPVLAARCALELQRRCAQVDRGAVGLPADLGLRVSLHVGPMVHMLDPVRGAPTFFGAQITRAARIEPATPEGEVYVTEAFAAELALCDAPHISCQYVGREATAKDYGIMPLYLLRDLGSTEAG
jgi:hypothetical protein